MEKFIKLWIVHVEKTRIVLLVTLEVPENRVKITNAVNDLMQNQVDIGNTFKNSKGMDFAKTVTKLLKEHIAIAADILSDLVNEDNVKLGEDMMKWDENADKISSAFGEDKIKFHMYNHLDFTFREFQSEVLGNRDLSIMFYDKALMHIKTMATDLYPFTKKS